MSRMRKIESEKGLLSNDDIDLNILTALKSSFYVYVRQLYNKSKKYKIENSYAVPQLDKNGI